MSIAHRIGCQQSVRVSRAHALTASRALIAQARHELDSLAQDLAWEQEPAEPSASQSEDSQSSARSLSQTLAALDAIGWPHQHLGGSS